jgi:hypothetical protein
MKMRCGDLHATAENEGTRAMRIALEFELTENQAWSYEVLDFAVIRPRVIEGSVVSISGQNSLPTE